MKSKKDFDAVEIKNKIQAKLLKEYQGMTEHETRAAIREELSSSKSPVAQLWRKLQKTSSTEKAA